MPLSVFANQLPANIERKAGLQALRAGARVIQRAVRAEIDSLDLSRSGKRKLKRAIKIKSFRKHPNKPTAIAVRLYRTTRGSPPTDPWWSHLIQRGTAPRYRHTKAKWKDPSARKVSTGQIQAQDFIARALSKSTAAAEQAFTDALAVQLQKIIDETATTHASRKRNT